MATIIAVMDIGLTNTVPSYVIIPASFKDTGQERSITYDLLYVMFCKRKIPISVQFTRSTRKDTSDHIRYLTHAFH